MISAAEIRRTAGMHQVDPMIIEKDYILGCYLRFLALEPLVAQSWVFKGGTCLKKCYFENYRFSEDLDFTIMEQLSQKTLENLIRNVNQRIQNKIGISFDSQEFVIEIIEDEYGKESFEARIYYRGPWIFRGSSPALRIHLNRDEIVLFQTKMNSVSHPYSDQNELPEITVQTYSLEEILVEKLRAVSGQRRFAIARDIFDIYYLKQNGTTIDSAINAFPEKCKIKGISAENLNLATVFAKEDQFRQNWQRNLEYLVPADLIIPFEKAWITSIELLKQALEPKN